MTKKFQIFHFGVYGWELPLVIHVWLAVKNRLPQMIVGKMWHYNCRLPIQVCLTAIKYMTNTCR